MEEPAGRRVIVVNGRVHEIPAPHSARTGLIEDSLAWWESLAILGGSLLSLGLLIGAGLGSVAAITGFSQLLITAGLAGAERYEFATAVGASAVVWTSAGISVYLGVDPSLIGSLVVFELFGALTVAAGVLGGLRNSARRDRRTRAST